MTYETFCTMAKEAHDLWTVVSVPQYITAELPYTDYDEYYERCELMCSALAMLNELQKAYVTANDIQKKLLMNVLRDNELDLVLCLMTVEPLYEATLMTLSRLPPIG